MKIDKIVEPYFGENMYILIDEETKKCAIVDPGGATDKVFSYLKNNGLDLEYILLTHGHGDHIGCVPELKEATNAQIIAHKDEQEILLDKKKNLSYSMRCGATEFEADRYVEEKESVKIGDLKLTFLHTPGHTKGCMCIKVLNHMFTGDTLFAGSMGRTDLYSGDNKQMEKTLKRLSNQEDNIIIYPGHGPNSTMGIEKATNPYMPR